MRFRAQFGAVGLALTVAAALPAHAGATAEVRFFRLHDRKGFVAGVLDGLSVDPLGTLRLADRAARLADVGEPFLFSAAPHPDGWVVGTGNGGKVLLVERSGELRTLFSAPEPEIFAVWADADGTVFAGSSPDGKVYRIAAGAAEEFFDPGETYIWSLARSKAGALLVATGTEGRLYEVDAAGRSRVLFDSEDTHLRALKVLPGGDLLVGTAGEGLILRIDPGGRARTLFDAAQPEVVALAAAADGSCYAALLASEASFTELGGRRPESGGGEEGGDDEQATVTVLAEGEEAAAAAGSRPPGFRGPRSELLRISADGLAESLWSFEEETVYSLLWHRDRLWVGTGLDGKLYSLRDRRMVLEKDVDERQVVALLEDRPGPAFATTNSAALYRLSTESERRGTYTSPALDAGQISRFGTLRWRGGRPQGAGLSFSARSGLSAEPDATWSDWTPAGSGREVALGDLPAGRFVQWRAEFEADGGASPTLTEVTLSYRQNNLPPSIRSLTVLEPGQILVPANFNPTNQVFEPVHPNRDGIFTTLETSMPRDDRRLKTVWKRGFRSLRWEAEDPNEDELVYELAFRPEGDESDWLSVASELDDDHYGFDATALPDGVYRFRLEAADRRPQSLDQGLTATEITEPVLIDHTPPALVSVEPQGAALRIVVEDAWNPLRLAEVSFDAGGWQPLAAVDGLLDGQREILLVEPPAGARLVLLRVMDAAFNSISFELEREDR